MMHVMSEADRCHATPAMVKLCSVSVSHASSLAVKSCRFRHSLCTVLCAAAVYKARDVSTGALYALKHIRLNADTDALKEVMQEGNGWMHHVG